MSAPAARSAVLKVERSRLGCSALILDFLPIFAKNVSIGMAASAVATGACPVATYKYKAAGRINKPTRTPSRNLGFNGGHLLHIPISLFEIINARKGTTLYCFVDLRHLPIHSCQISLHVFAGGKRFNRRTGRKAGYSPNQHVSCSLGT